MFWEVTQGAAARKVLPPPLVREFRSTAHGDHGTPYENRLLRPRILRRKVTKSSIYNRNPFSQVGRHGVARVAQHLDEARTIREHRAAENSPDHPTPS